MLKKKNKRKKMEELKKKLAQLKNVKLPAILKKYGEATQESSIAGASLALFEIAD